MAVADDTGGRSTTVEEPLKSNVSTGRDNHVEVSPFEVQNVSCPERWDASSETLPLSFRVMDYNGRARAGRILYMTSPAQGPGQDTPASNPVVIHTHPLSMEMIGHGTHDLPANQQWDGTITEGSTGRKKATADLCPIRVVVEIWNHNGKSPAAAGGQGVHVSRDFASVNLDVLERAAWDRRMVIPYDDPEEPQHGFARMDIRVKNVAEGTPVRIMVARINRVDNSSGDFMYERTGRRPEFQSGLEGAAVRKGRILLPDGSKPEVKFDNYSEHWKHPGNNFYCFNLAFGEHGGYMTASERDHVKHRNDCLHMRYTVFIHRPAGDLPDYTNYANNLHNFFRKNTKDFRSYIMRGGPSEFRDWFLHFRHRYIVIFLGHAACYCKHKEHPKNSQGWRKPLYDQGFDPLENCCPTTVANTPDVQKSLAAEERKDRKKYYKTWPKNEPLYGGCGNKTHVAHEIILGKSRRENYKLVYLNWPGRAARDSLVLAIRGERSDAIKMARYGPRLCFFNGGCRTMLTTNFGEHFTQNETRYYHGWVYSPGCDYGRFCYDLFTRWIKGTPKDPAQEEADILRFEQAYRYAANRGTRPRYHPRLMDRYGCTAANDPPNRAEEALS